MAVIAGTTLVMGARGSVGKHVLHELIARGVPVRASARRPEPGQFPEDVDVYAADLTDPASLGPAFDGVEQVFLYANHQGVEDVVETARSAGVRRIVLMSSGSVIHPSSKGNPITEEHREVEEAFAAAADLTVVPIRPLVLATNTLGWAYPIKASGVVPLYRPDALTAPIHERDIAAVTVAALTGDDATTGMLTGPARMSQRDQVATIGAALGRELAVTALTRADALAHFSRFMPAEEAGAVISFLDDAAAENSPATGAVEQILGRPALPFGTWAADHATDFA
ncbi:NAD(P)H-binding protein [Actinoplanes bogorensis]|uniref:NAD(P)H-binding protein n=1 Tax=Paractinoplanes bogorensis TaxID=1610840 RepID=A0ABS5YTC8_9ACTN|nr:NAD(P)H-binding protein [Actinoplanes bogorensis]MBU2665295.1 NAD(P)H-binding protein [Actinoplanes bogorensis]